MRYGVHILVAALLLLVAWYGLWHSMLSDDVARVKATIAHHEQAFKARHRHVTLKADAVERSGFPFAMRVKVTRPTLSMIDGQQTYAVSLDHIELEPKNKAQGRYRVIALPFVEALYAQAGAAPESYEITLSEVPDILLRAQGSSRECPGLPGLAPCKPAQDDAPLISLAVRIPKKLVLAVTLGEESEKIGFDATPLNVPLFFEIPQDASRPLQLFVGMLREALVFKTGKTID